MIKLAFFNNKGGVGKSTAAINVAHAMSRLGKKILVVDCDSQMNAFRFLSDEQDMEIIQNTRYENIKTACYNQGIDVLAKKFFEFDFMLLDLPPSLDEQTSQIISSCDYVFVPIELGTFAISGIANVTEAIAATGARFGGCFVSKFDRSNPIDHELDKQLRQTLKVMSTKIPSSRVIKNSISYRMTAFEYMPWEEAAGAYTELTNEIITICANLPGKEVSDNA